MEGLYRACFMNALDSGFEPSKAPRAPGSSPTKIIPTAIIPAKIVPATIC